MDKKKLTPLHLAAQAGHTKTATLLLERGASVTITNNKGYNALTLAIKKGNRFENKPE
jgi:receptor-interacting serine/threonine-protein kinase 4